MTTTAVCLQLGSAVSTKLHPSSYYSQTFDATSMNSKHGITPYSLDQLDVIVDGSELGDTNIYNPMELASWVPLLSPTSIVSIHIATTTKREEAAGGATGAAGAGACAAFDIQPINMSFILAGLKCASERRELDGSRVLTATRKVTVPVGAAPLRKNKNTNEYTTIFDDDDDDDDDDNDIIDEDALLLEVNLLPPPPGINPWISRKI